VFWLKKHISLFLMPVPFCLLLLALGLLFARAPGKARIGRYLIVASTVLLLLFSNTFVSIRLLGPLEGRYPAVSEIPPGSAAPDSIAACKFVAVLGAGHTDMPGYSATSQLSTSGLERIVEATRILRAVPEARLIVSGPGDPGRPSHASILASAAESLGISSARIILIDTAWDTEDESFAVAKLAGGSRTALVTSAWHMPRAAHLFRKAGVNFVACPCDFVAREGIQLHWNDFGWDSASLQRSTLAVHEWIGLLWLRLRNA
jgi:uncharacterized SAM-binding protein YcdF (DUF218 family)